MSAGQLSADSCLVESRGQGSAVKILHGLHTSVAAADKVDLTKYGISKVIHVVVSLVTDPALACDLATAVAGTGDDKRTFTLKTWKRTGAGDCTPIAATAFSKIVSYTAYCE